MTSDKINAMRGNKKNRGTNALPFARILNSVMRERSLTLRQVADLAGVRTSVVGDWTAGATPHDLRAVSRLAKSLGMNFQALLLGEHEENVKVTSLAELFDEAEVFDGLVRLSVKKLVPRGTAK